MESKNIWESINFEPIDSKSAYQYLSEQATFLEEASKHKLKMEVEAIDSYLDDKEPATPVALYKLFVVTPAMGNLRKKILTVVEGRNGLHFPVDVISHLDGKEYDGIDESAFIDKIKYILGSPLVKRTIENLFRLSL